MRLLAWMMDHQEMIIIVGSQNEDCATQANINTYTSHN